MALVASKLALNLTKFIDSESKLFTKSPSDVNDAATKWTNALHGYMSLVSPPAPGLSAAATGAKSAMYASILAAFNSQTFNTQIPTILMTYAATLSAGYAPNYVPVPPTSPPALAPVFQRALNGASASEFIAQFTLVVDAWMRTGTASLVTPSGVLPPILWF